jgi:biotin carboxylase
MGLVLFVDHAPADARASLRRYTKKGHGSYKVGVIFDSRNRAAKERAKKAGVDVLISCEMAKPLKIAEALLPHQDDLVAITCRGDGHIPTLAKIVPHVPYLRTPTVASLGWAVDKIAMRERLHFCGPEIGPRFAVVSDAKKSTRARIAKEVGFPLVLKPAGLASSLLVSICYHQEELEATMKRALRHIKSVYAENNRTTEPHILVEQFLEGDQYSVDVYVSSRGTLYYCPMVHIKTGRSIGFDDFFGYQQITPTLLKRESIDEARQTAACAIRALGLRSVTAHVELMKTEAGWKVIELGPRMGGFRHQMYSLSFDIDHSLNDVLIRMDKKPEISKTRKGYAAVVKFYAKEEGTLTHLTGTQKVQGLAAIKKVSVHKKVGDRCRFAKNGGRSVVDLILFDKERSKLLADIRRAEQTIVIKTSKTSS